MNKRQKEVAQHQLDAEKAVLEQLRQQYQRALNDIDRKIRILESDELTQSRIYRLEYQKALKKQVEAILEKLHSDQFTTIQQFLSTSYTDAFVGTAYDMFGQGVQLIMPVDKNAAVKAVVTDSKLSASLYESLGVDIKKLKNTISSEITRGIAASLPHTDIARNISSVARVSLSRATTIVRTEAHRIQEASRHDAQAEAVNKGAKVVKQWDSTLDGKTRRTHRKLDGQVREVDEPFEIEGKKAMYPGDFGDPAEDCNCRCIATQRARISLNENELKTLEDRAKYWGLDKTDDFADFRKKYLKASEKEKISIEKSAKSGIIKERDTTTGIGIQFFANKTILKQNSKQLKKSMKSWEDRMAEHMMWINEPTLHDKGWDAKTPAHQAGLIKHWKHEVDIFKRNIQEAKDELKKRGDDDE